MIEEKIKKVIIEKYGSLKSFSKRIDVPYTTIDTIFKRGFQNAGYSNIKKICKELNISVDKLANDEIAYNDVFIDSKGTIRVQIYISSNIYHLKLRNNMSDEQLALLLGINKNDIDGLERGKIRADSFIISKLSKIFNISIDDLLNKDLSRNEKYTKEETKEKITRILDNSDLEEDKKNMIGTMVNMVCEEKESV